ncbi:MAG: hypothetical protein R3F60_12875 [bacterium]
MLGLGDLPDAALTVGLRPDALARGFEAFEGRLGLDADALGPLGTAWRRARQGAADVLGELAGPSPAPDLAADWGLVGAEAVQITVAAPEAAPLGRALLARLRGELDGPLPAVVVRGRATFTIADPGRLVTSLERLASRAGVATHQPGEGQRPAWLGDAGLGAEVRLVGRDPETGTWAILRIRGSRGAVDVIVPPKPGPARPALDDLAAQVPAPPPAEVALVARLDPARLAGLEAALDAHLGLRHPDATIREAAGDVLATCTARWADVADQAWQIDASLALADGLPALTVEARLTEAGTAAWRRDARPLPLPSVPAPLGWQVGWAAPDDAPGPAWIDDTAACGAGHPVLAALAALPLLPRVLPPAALAAVEPPGGFGLARADGAAGGIVGASPGPGGAIPHLVGALRGEGEPPADQGEAVEVGGELRFVTPGAVPAMLAWRPLPGGRALARFGLGEGALTEGAPEPPTADRLVVVAWPGRIAAALRGAGEAGPEVAALGALGDRIERLALRVFQPRSDAVRLVLEVRSPAPSP